MKIQADIDIDIPVGTDIAQLFPTAVPASRVHDNNLTKHPCGYYFENIAIDVLTGLAAIPHKEAEQNGYTKVDFLHLTLLSDFKSKAEFRKACNEEPDWDMLKYRTIVDQLFQIKNHFDLVQKISPRCVQELADIIALIRPNKRHLLGDYLKNKEKIRPLLYRTQGDDKSAFRKSHSVAYSVTIIAQLNLLRSRG